MNLPKFMRSSPRKGKLISPTDGIRKLVSVQGTPIAGGVSMRRPLFAAVMALSGSVYSAPVTAADKVTPETYIRAETDRSFGNIAAQAGGVNKFYYV